MKRSYEDVLSEYGNTAYDESFDLDGNQVGAYIPDDQDELSDDQKKLNWLLGLEKETLADMVHQQSKIIEKLQKAAKEQAQRLVC